MTEHCTSSTVEERVRVISEEEAINHVGDDEMIWIPDSGATIHATSHREYSTNYTSGDYGIVKMGNNNKAAIDGKGDVHLETTNGTRLVLKSVRHVEALRLNIILVPLLCKEKHKLTKGNKVVARGEMVSLLFHVSAKLSSVCVNALEKEDSCVLWHKRLGYMSEMGMTELVKKDLLKGMKSVHLNKCSDWLVG